MKRGELKLYFDLPSFTKAFEKQDKFCAVEGWYYSDNTIWQKEVRRHGWIVVVTFANNRKVRLFTDKFPNLSYIIDLIQTNKLKHNTNGR